MLCVAEMFYWLGACWLGIGGGHCPWGGGAGRERRRGSVHNAAERHLERHWPFQHRLDCLPGPVSSKPATLPTPLRYRGLHCSHRRVHARSGVCIGMLFRYILNLYNVHLKWKWRNSKHRMVEAEMSVRLAHRFINIVLKVLKCICVHTPLPCICVTSVSSYPSACVQAEVHKTLGHLCGNVLHSRLYWSQKY